MPISARMMDTMVAAGLTGEQVAMLVKADLADAEAARIAGEAVQAEKRAKDAARKRASRVQNFQRTSTDIHGQSRTPADAPDTDPCPPRDINSTPTSSEPNGSAAEAAIPDPAKPEAALFARGRDVFGKQHGGGLTTRLLKAKGGNVALARSAIEEASTKADPRQWTEAVIHGGNGTRKTGGNGNAKALNDAFEDLGERLREAERGPFDRPLLAFGGH